jgi:hypothetical protein
MNLIDFNKKYKKYLQKDNPGLLFYDINFIKWLDNQFQEFIKIPEFSYSYINSKFGYGIFYATGISIKQIREVEQKMTDIHQAE